MDYRLEIMPRALLDSENIRNWRAGHSEDWADRWYRNLIETIETLRNFPRRCPVVQAGGLQGAEVRELTFGKGRMVHRILFEIEGEIIRVVAVIHSARGL